MCAENVVEIFWKKEKKLNLNLSYQGHNRVGGERKNHKLFLAHRMCSSIVIFFVNKEIFYTLKL